jgi:hypothetical protein
MSTKPTQDIGIDLVAKDVNLLNEVEKFLAGIKQIQKEATNTGKIMGSSVKKLDHEAANLIKTLNQGMASAQAIAKALAPQNLGVGIINAEKNLLVP